MAGTTFGDSTRTCITSLHARATEYTGASIDASNAQPASTVPGFPPTINSYMYGNAVAIAKHCRHEGRHGYYHLVPAKGC